MAKALAVFCDFDGTITERDMIVTLCEKFCPAGWDKIKEDILSRKTSVRQGVADLFAMIPSSKKAEMLQYARETMRLRAGFKEFLEFCKQNGLRVIVASGGIDFFVEPLMEPYKQWIHKLYSIPSDFSGPAIQLQHPYGCDTCGTCKVKIMNEYPDTIKILVGDSITDLHGAHHANIVYARNGLKDYLDQDKVAYKPFETFFDVIHSLGSFRGVDACANPHPHHDKVS